MDKSEKIRRNLRWIPNLWPCMALHFLIFLTANGSQGQTLPATATTPTSPAAQVNPSPSPAQGQQSESSIASLQVTVTDAQQHSLNGVTCSLLRPNDSKAVVATATTDEQGVATLTVATSGIYILRVESKGFETFTQ